MKQNNKEIKSEIIKILVDYMTKFPEQRFGQMLFNLDVNQFKKETEELRDIYNDSDDEILKRMTERLEKLKLTTN